MEFENDVKTVIAEMAEELNKNYSDQKLFDLSLGERLPQKDEIIDFVDELRKVTFPGFFGRENMAYANKKYFAGHKLSLLYDKLFRQIKVALSYKNDAKSYQEIAEDAQEKALGFIRRIPEVQALLCKDVEAEYNGDPAANSREEIIFSYPGLFAIFVYRYAHVLYQMKVPFIPRIMTEYAHGETGIDINPGANIGEYFFIDHGTGIVIGETTVIGEHVKLYQGVTLGALSTKGGQKLRDVRRHPTIKDNVTIYSGASILGGETVIEEGVVVGGNAFITKSVSKGTKVSVKNQELIFHSDDETLHHGKNDESWYYII